MFHTLHFWTTDLMSKGIFTDKIIYLSKKWVYTQRILIECTFMLSHACTNVIKIPFFEGFMKAIFFIIIKG